MCVLTEKEGGVETLPDDSDAMIYRLDALVCNCTVVHRSLPASRAVNYKNIMERLCGMVVGWWIAFLDSLDSHDSLK